MTAKKIKTKALGERSPKGAIIQDGGQGQVASPAVAVLETKPPTAEELAATRAKVAKQNEALETNLSESSLNQIEDQGLDDGSSPRSTATDGLDDLPNIQANAAAINASAALLADKTAADMIAAVTTRAETTAEILRNMTARAQKKTSWKEDAALDQAPTKFRLEEVSPAVLNPPPEGPDAPKTAVVAPEDPTVYGAREDVVPQHPASNLIRFADVQDKEQPDVARVLHTDALCDAVGSYNFEEPVYLDFLGHNPSGQEYECTRIYWEFGLVVDIFEEEGPDVEAEILYKQNIIPRHTVEYNKRDLPLRYLPIRLNEEVRRSKIKAALAA